MAEEKYPVRLLIQGDACSYSEVQIHDEVQENIRDVLKVLFNNPNMAFQLNVGEKELEFTGMTRKELITSLARRIYEDRREFCESILEHLELVSKLVESESGIIFVNQEKRTAAKSISRLASSMSYYTVGFENLTPDQQIGFCKMAEGILNQTVWWNARSFLLKE